MKARKTLTLLLLAALTFAACKYDDSALWEQVNQNTEELAAQAARIAALEAWQAQIFSINATPSRKSGCRQALKMPTSKYPAGIITTS